jgi:hypothetical protein
MGLARLGARRSTIERVVGVRRTRSLRRVFLVAGAAATLSAVPARAQSAPHWYENGKLIVGTVSVEARGWMRFDPPSTQLEPRYVRCHGVEAKWTLTNPSTGEAGIAELTSLTAGGCQARPVGCSGASAGLGGIPKRASVVRRDRFEVAVSLEGMSMGAECARGGFGGGGAESGGLSMEITRPGVMQLSGTFFPCNPHEFPICVFHPAQAHGKLVLANAITVK